MRWNKYMRIFKCKWIGDGPLTKKEDRPLKADFFFLNVWFFINNTGLIDVLDEISVQISTITHTII